MPLHQGYSRATVSKNIELMMHEGYPQPQAVAASLENARKSWRTRHPRGPYPGHLSGGGSNRAGSRAMKYQVVTEAYDNGRWVSLKQARKTAALWRRHHLPYVRIVDEMGRFH